MLVDYEKFRILDENKQNEFYAEVNWDKNEPKVKNCQLIRFTFPDGKVAIVKKELLNEMLFYIGTEEEQRKMIPQKVETVHAYKTVLGIKATKDIAKGEMINFPVSLSIPCTMLNQEIIGGIKKPKSPLL